MENNEMIEVKETEMVEVNEADVNSGKYDLLTGLVIGAATIGGAVLLKKVVKPIWSYGKMKLEERKAKKAAAKEAAEPEIVDSEEESEEE